MRQFSNNGSMYGNVIAFARFNTSRQASSCQLTLSALFDTIKEKVDALYERGRGQADLSDLAKVYEQYGFRNENGWEQEHVILVSENEVAWPLSFGVRKSDVEDLLHAMEPQSIEFHDLHEPIEEWQLYPMPELAISFDEADEVDMNEYFEDDEYLGNPPKRVIH